MTHPLYFTKWKFNVTETTRLCYLSCPNFLIFLIFLDLRHALMEVSLLDKVPGFNLYIGG